MVRFSAVKYKCIFLGSKPFILQVLLKFPMIQQQQIINPVQKVINYIKEI